MHNNSNINDTASTVRASSANINKTATLRQLQVIKHQVKDNYSLTGTKTKFKHQTRPRLPCTQVNATVTYNMNLSSHETAKYKWVYQVRAVTTRVKGKESNKSSYVNMNKQCQVQMQKPKDVIFKKSENTKSTENQAVVAMKSNKPREARNQNIYELNKSVIIINIHTKINGRDKSIDEFK